jgi:hypothetical protein
MILLFLLAAQVDPQSALTRGIVAFGRGDLAGARRHLDEAEALTTEPTLLAGIHRQRGIIDQVEGKRLASIVSFLRALYFDPAVDLSEREHKGEVRELFLCARKLSDAGVTERAAEVRYAGDFERSDWRCPTGAEPPPAPETAPPPPSTVLPPPPPADEAASIWESPWLWIGVGAVVVIGGVTTAVLLAGGDDPYGGTSGVNIRLEP